MFFYHEISFPVFLMTYDMPKQARLNIIKVLVINKMGPSNQKIETAEDPATDAGASSLAVSQRGQKEDIIDQKCVHKIETRYKNPKIGQYPYNCIGMLMWDDATHNHQKETGTAFLVGSDLILTALHCAIDSFHELHKSMIFYPKPNCSMRSLQDPNTELAKVKDFRYCKGSYFSDKKIVIPTNKDFCLIRLDREIKRQKYFKLGFDYALEGNVNAEIFGYPNDLIEKKSQYTQFGAKGRIASIKNGAIYYEIDTEGGQSGSPLIVETLNNQKIAVGIHAKAINSKNQNCACQISYDHVQNIHKWAFELTGEPSRIYSINCDKVQFETNPQVDDQIRRQEYSYITLAHSLSKKVNNPELELNPSKLEKKMSNQSNIKKSNQYDLWQTIKRGKFMVNRYPYNCIGLIIASYVDSNNERKFHYGTGCLINNKIVLTSIYNVKRFQNQNYSQEYEDIQFYPGLHGDISEKQNESKKRRVIEKKYQYMKNKPTDLKQMVDASLAVLLLDQPVQVKKRYILIGEDYDDINQVYLFGYGWNQLNKTNRKGFTAFKQRGSEGNISEVIQGTIFHNAYSENGSEGSPLLVEYVKGQLFIVGIHIVAGKRQGGQGSFCMALKMTKKRVALINKWILQLGHPRKVQSYSFEQKQTFKVIFPQISSTYQQEFNQLSQSTGSSFKNLSLSEISTNLAYSSHFLGKYEESNRYLIQSKNNQPSAFQGNKIKQFYYHNLMGLNNLYLVDYQKAEKCFKSAEDTINESFESEARPILYNNFGILYLKKGNLPLSMSFFEKMKWSVIEGKSKIGEIIQSNNSICLYKKSNKLTEKQVQSRLLQVFQELRTPKSPQQMLFLSVVVYNLSTNYLKAANYYSAMKYFEIFLKITDLLQLTERKQYFEFVNRIEKMARSLLECQIIDKNIIMKAVKLLRRVAGDDIDRQQLLKNLMYVILPTDQDEQ